MGEGAFRGAFGSCMCHCIANFLANHNRSFNCFGCMTVRLDTHPELTRIDRHTGLEIYRLNRRAIATKVAKTITAVFNFPQVI